MAYRTDMGSILDRAIAQYNQGTGDPYVDALSEARQFSQEQTQREDRKNLQRQKMMQIATEGWADSTDVNSLGKMSNWLDSYRVKNQGDMSDITLEYADLLKDKISNRNERIVKLHTDAAMLEESKNQWLGIADHYAERPLGHEDYNDLSSSIHQFIKMKNNMQTENADFLALPQFEHIKHDMIGQEAVIKEIMTEAKSGNVFSEQEYEWTTRALEEGNWKLIQEETLKRQQDIKRNVDSILEGNEGLNAKMDLYKRIQKIKSGERAPLDELGLGMEGAYIGLEDLGYVQDKDGEFILPEQKEGFISDTYSEEDLATLSTWQDMAGVGTGMGSVEEDVIALDKLYEKEYGNSFIKGKRGFENFDPNSEKSNRVNQEDNYNDIKDPDGFINIDKAVDSGFGIGEAVITTGAVLSAAAYNYPKIKEVGKSAYKFMEEVGFLSEDEIAKMFADKDAKNIMNSISKASNKLHAIDKDANPADYKKALIELTNIQNTAKKQLMPKFSEKMVKLQKSATADLTRAQELLKDVESGIVPTIDPEYVTPAEARKLVEDSRKNLDKVNVKINKRNQGMTDLLKNPNKWNLWKMKAGLGLRQTGRTIKDLAKVGGKTFAKLTPLDAAMWGWYLGDSAGLNNYWKTAAAGTGYYSAKQVMNLVAKKGGMMKAMMNPTLQSKVAGYLITKAPWLAAKMGLKMGAGLAGTTFTGGIASGFGLAMAAWTAKDLYNLIQDVPELTQYVMEWGRGEYDEDLGKPQVLPKF